LNIVFDLDGTLIDSAPDIRAIANSILSDLGKEPLSLEQTRSFIGEGSAVLIRRLMKARDIEETGNTHANLLDLFVSRYESMPVESPYYPGVDSMLGQLKAAGHRLGLCTNKPEGPTRAVLDQSGLGRRMDAIIAGGMINSRKPEPDMLLHVLADLGAGPSLYVGDSETDADTARSAGIPFALFSGGYRKGPVEKIHHDWLFGHFDELPVIVTALAAGPA
jgi:phosphoglycolate phosphatase